LTRIFGASVRASVIVRLFIAAFEAQHPSIHVEPAFENFDKLHIQLGAQAALMALDDYPPAPPPPRDPHGDSPAWSSAVPRPPVQRLWLHGLLFVATFITLSLTGGLFWAGFAPSADASFTTFRFWLGAFAAGIPYGLWVIAILGAHEMGHYLTAKRYAINASPPYFLPAPIEINFIGTFGAFIRLRSPVIDRRQLMDVGAAGPWMGFGVALLMLIVGVQRSWVAAPDAFDAHMVIQLAGTNLLAGDSVITWAIRHAFVGDQSLILHPIAVAGWIGMLVTALNLLPLGQLDGGHILYALLGRHQRIAAFLAWIGLLVLGQWFWPWWAWAALALILGGGRLTHPRVLESHRPIPPSRVPLGWASVILFIVTFAPIPIAF